MPRLVDTATSGIDARLSKSQANQVDFPLARMENRAPRRRRSAWTAEVGPLQDRDSASPTRDGHAEARSLISVAASWYERAPEEEGSYVMTVCW
ncbi:hypothetical protein GCM10011512_02090 [Tersicoccus solisilvae]|uniref:Uncharacterized protein n=1 Tax=Tersicoccus solisilvae TaxID=1882339 RepID=A0ABQ1NKF0_9MICC|nr:hypothetical protein GCM10011512_02090 [Tersicoccus solisilvae]